MDLYPLYWRKFKGKGRINYEQIYREFVGLQALKQISGNKIPKRGLRIMTYNINAFEFNKGQSWKMILEVLRKADADIVAFQEFIWDTDFIAQASQELGYNYVKFAPVIRKPYFGNAIMSRFKIENCKVHFFQVQFREPRNWMKCSFFGGQLELINTHLDVYDKSGRTRLAQIEEILDYVKTTKKYLAVLGDFNSMKSGDYTEKEIKKIEYYSLNPELSGSLHPLDFKVSKKIDKSGKLFESFELIGGKKPKFSVKTGKRVDFIYVNKELSPYLRNCDIIYSLASDHLPIYCDL